MNTAFIVAPNPRPWRVRFIYDWYILFFCGLFVISATPLGRAAVPGNDNFISPVVLSSSNSSFSVSGNNTGATLETNELGLGGCSVWYTWTAPSTGWVSIDTTALPATSQLDTVLGVFTGSTLATLVPVAYNDEAWGATGASKVVFSAVSGTKYRIAVYGYYDGNATAQGTFQLNISSVTPAVRATAIAVSPATVDVTNSSQSVTVTVSISSTSDLFASGTSKLLLRTPDGLDALDLGTLSTANCISGNSLAGNYTKTVSIPKGSQRGNWIPTLQFVGATGTMVWAPAGKAYFQDHWIINGATQLLEVKNTDSKAPDLVAFSVNPTSAGPCDTVTANLSITDTGSSGFQQADIWISNGGAWLTSVTSANLISGDTSNGQYQISFDVPSDLVPGSYHFDVSVQDTVGNWNYYEGISSGNILSGVTLQVTNITLAGWRIKNFGLAVNDGDGANLADPDKDGIPNLLEFATNHGPQTVDSGVSSVTSDGSHLMLDYNRAYAAVGAGVQFLAEWSDSPAGPWSTSGVQETVTGTDSYTDHVRASISLGSSPHRFMRLRAFLPPP